jgi:chloramphenicol-sensitive protein RarD
VTPGRRGTAFGAAAYLLWGLFPLYWPLLEPSGSLEVLAHRVLWSLVVVVVLLAVTRRLASVRAVVADRRRMLQLSATAVLIAVNWGAYIYGVTHDRVVETSLGYF